MKFLNVSAKLNITSGFIPKENTDNNTGITEEENTKAKDE